MPPVAGASNNLSVTTFAGLESLFFLFETCLYFTRFVLISVPTRLNHSSVVDASVPTPFALCTYIYIYTHVHIHMQICKYANMANKYANIYIYINVYTCIYIRIYMYIYIYIYLFMYLLIFTNVCK